MGTFNLRYRYLSGAACTIGTDFEIRFVEGGAEQLASSGAQTSSLASETPQVTQEILLAMKLSIF